MSDNNEILGRGWSFPPTFNPDEHAPVMLDGIEDVENSILVIIRTKLGERILRNEFGSNIYDLLFEPLNENMKTYMADHLKKTLSINEPRITVKHIALVQNNPAEGRIDIHIQYETVENYQINNLVVPFYTPDNMHIT